MRAALAAGLVLLGAAAYANALQAGFVYDDLPSIVDNGTLRELSNYLPGRPGWHSRPNRVVGYLTFALDRRLHGLDPAWFHATNVAIHLANALLVFAIGLLLYRTPRLRESRLAPLAPALAFAAAALFVAHPLETQAVTYVVQRLTSLTTLFYLGAVALYLRARLGAAGRRSVAWYLAALAAALLATKTKEIAFTLPAALVACEWLFFRTAVWSGTVLVAPFLAVAALIPASLVHLARPTGELLTGAATATAVDTAVSRLDYLRTQVTVVASYLRLLALPVGQNVDPDVPIAHAFLEPRVLACGALLLALAGAAVLLVRGANRADGRRLDPSALLAAFGIAWFFLTLSVESSLIPIVDVMNEHRVYLPSAGLFLGLAAALGWAATRGAPRRAGAVVVLVAAGLAAALAIATHRRNEVWRSELTLWADAAAKSPQKPRPLNNLGAALSDAGRGDEAAQVFLAAIRANPGHAEAYYNLGRLTMRTDRPIDEAIPLFRAAVALRPDYRDAYANLAGALVKAGRPAEAVAVLVGAGAVVRESPEAQFNLGVARALLGDVPRAAEQVAELRRLASPLAPQLEAFLRSASTAPPGGR